MTDPTRTLADLARQVEVVMRESGGGSCVLCWADKAEPHLSTCKWGQLYVAALVPPPHFVEPEGVTHDFCPNADEIDHGTVIETTHPQMHPFRQLDDTVGHQRRYRCEKCETVVVLNFPPVAALVPPQEQETMTKPIQAAGSFEEAALVPPQEQEHWKMRARMMAQAADTEKAEAKHWRERATELEAQLAALRAQIELVVRQMREAAPDRPQYSQWPEWEIERKIRKWADTLASLSRPHPPEEQP